MNHSGKSETGLLQENYATLTKAARMLFFSPDSNQTSSSLSLSYSFSLIDWEAKKQAYVFGSKLT